MDTNQNRITDGAVWRARDTLSNVIVEAWKRKTGWYPAHQILYRLHVRIALGLLGMMAICLIAALFSRLVLSWQISSLWAYGPAVATIAGMIFYSGVHFSLGQTGPTMGFSEKMITPYLNKLLDLGFEEEQVLRWRGEFLQRKARNKLQALAQEYERHLSLVNMSAGTAAREAWHKENQQLLDELWETNDLFVTLGLIEPNCLDRLLGGQSDTTNAALAEA